MRTRLAIVVLLISGTLAGVFGANIVAGSSSTLTGTSTKTHVLRFSFRGRVTPRVRSKSFTFSVPAAAAVQARLRWGNGDARLRERLRRNRRTIQATGVSVASRHQTHYYTRVDADTYRLKVRSLRGGTHFRTAVVATWTEVVSDPPAGDTTSSTPTGSTGTTGTTGSSTPPAAVDKSTPPVWDAAFMDQPQTTATLSQALEQAKTFNVIVATKGMYKAWVGQMKQANPNLLLLVYLNGTFSMGDTGSNYPSTWYERDASGNKIKSVSFGNYLMDVSNPGWISDVNNRCQTFKAYSGYDGCFLDTLGTAPLNPNYVTGLPINQSTGTTWTKLDWLNATKNIAATSGAAIGSAPLYGNGIANGMKYFEKDGGATSRILDGANGGMVELFLRAPFASPTYYEKESQWLQEMSMLRDSAANGRVLLTITKVWSSATQSQKDSWNKFALSSFLLGYTPGSDWFAFRYDHNAAYDNSYWDAQIGVPTNTFSKIGGVYQRSFTNGRVLVNPTNSSVTVALGSGSWTGFDGQTVSGSITLQPETGQVLVNA